MAQDITPGLLVLHGNRLEDLRQVVFDWCARQPLHPLEEALFLVQSNGIAEWLKLALAQDQGICAATRIELPARFLWRAYRQVLGRDAVPAHSPFDKVPLAWRLMRLLPALLGESAFVPLQHFLADGDPLRRYQLAVRLADLFDQYQVYRADWLQDWSSGHDVLRRADGQTQALSDDQRWQALLWRAICADIPSAQRASSRADIHHRFVESLNAGNAPQHRLPRRVVLFGASSLPLQTLEALAALATHCQVILAVPNPCRFHWGDIIDGRELLRAARRRQPLREGHDLAQLPLEDLHAHGHPLLAAWGRQGRDFIRLLDLFDDAAATQEHFDIGRIDLFDDAAGQSLLQQLQARIRELEPLNADIRPTVADSDRSIVFHIAHSPLREVEILHDQLLTLLADGSLTPRDIIVMVPDIETFAPAIHAVFGQHSSHDVRHIPYTIADQRSQQVNPLLGALEWLLALPTQRCTASELRDLLDVPALARRFDLDENDLPRLTQWIAGAGVRWGLSQAQRDTLNLAACGEQNSWLFGLERMLLGYACGEDGPFAGIEPYDEIGGLDAAAVGGLAALVQTLQHWSTTLNEPATPGEWGERLRTLLLHCFTAASERDQMTLAALENALQSWQDACASAGFEDTISLPVVRSAWLALLDEPNLTRRFLGGGVTFCSLMPMRAIPFEVVCLLGMNDGDYPRRASRADFDLLALPGLARPGDRSRRDDDRYLMLEALLSARRQLYVSWCGRNVRDNSAQPPSVLVAQLRDYLAVGWADDVLDARTTEHPLQPFSRRYFEGGMLTTWASEWRAAHQPEHLPAAEDAPVAQAQGQPPLTLAQLATFLKNPVRAFFRQRLEVVFDDGDDALADDEPFALNALEEYQLVDSFLDAARLASDDDLIGQIQNHAARIARSGQLPPAGFGAREQARLVNLLTPVWQQWQALQTAWPENADKATLCFTHGEVVLEDWLDGLRSNGHERVLLQLEPAILCDKRGFPRGDKLILPWLRQLAASACGLSMGGIVVGRDAVLHLPPLSGEAARSALEAVLHGWQQGMQEPLPLACKTALAYLAKPALAAKTYQGDDYQQAGEVADACLARVYPDFDRLCADGRFAGLAQQLYGPLHAWLASITVQTHDAGATGEDGDEPDA